MARMILYVLGGLLMLAGVALLFFETGLDAWVPAGVAMAGLIILVGLLVVGLSERSPRAPAPEREREPVREREVEVIRR